MHKFATALTQKLRNRLRIARYPFLRHEGMTSFKERINLYHCAASSRVGTIVELGPYFGASTAALAAGISKHKTENQIVYVFDSFKTREDTYFASRVETSAQRSGTQQLLKREGGWVHWDDCFGELSAPFAETLVVTKALLQDIEWQDVPIDILHIDMPKDYKIGQDVFSKFFPSLQKGSLILFQDFVYQWSAEMIAAFGFLITSALARPISIISDTLTLECKAPGTQLLEHLNQEMRLDSETVQKGINRAIERTSALASKEQTAVLRIALCQSLYHGGNHRQALAELGKILAQFPQSRMVIRGISELLEGDFEHQPSC